ncbi:transposase [Pseudomonas chlororaphis]|uniref:transposase n=1 Tax=Pseudomonas chlororaphis TaxID=587753 RepID=UPI001CB898AC
MARYSIEHREWVVRQMMPPLNRTVPELMEATGITDATLYAWRKQARAAGAVVPGDFGALIPQKRSLCSREAPTNSSSVDFADQSPRFLRQTLNPPHPFN